MLSKRTIFALSLALSLLVHGVFLVLAPRMTVFVEKNVQIASPVARFYRVHIAEPAEAPKAPPEGASNGAKQGKAALASRPGSVTDLLRRGRDDVQPAQATGKVSEVPQLQERVATDAVGRQYDLSPDESSFKIADAKILEITEAVARKNIDVPRKLIRPSPDRILGENEFPTLRLPRGDQDQVATRFDGLPAFFEAREQAMPQGKDVVPTAESVAKDALPPVEQAMTRAAVAEETIEARAQSAYAFIDDAVDIKLDTFLPGAGEIGYFRVRIVPREDSAIETLPKDVTFVMDASGSITQTKLNATRKGVQAAIALLKPEDRFNVVVFRDTADRFQPDFVPATDENKAAAKAYLGNARIGGETDVFSALQAVLQGTPRPGVPSEVVVISDGRATVGVRDARAIINGLTETNNLRNGIFAFGGGETVDRYLMDLLAYRNKGESFVAPKTPDIEKEFPRFMQRLNEPLLVNLSADYGQIHEANVFPRVIPDFFKGKVVTVYGRFDPAKDREFVMRLTGTALERTKELIFRADLKKAESGNEDIARQWAFQKAYAIIGRISRDGETPELLGQLRELKQKYGVSTSYDQ